MIHIDRSRVAAPEDLTLPDGAGKREIERVKHDLKAWRDNPKADADWKFEFKTYKRKQVVLALHALFSGKCAYCESRYAATQPMDVEHWRPKSQIMTAGGETIRPGYFWLAADWDNLLPSCIDCNRRRKHTDAVTDRFVNLGKADQFPLAPGSRRADSPGGEIDEEPLLLHPCHDRPKQFLEFNKDGVILPRRDIPAAKRLRAKASIRVYALNRAGLVLNRRETLRLVELSVQVVKALHDVSVTRQKMSESLWIVLDDLMMSELRSLARRCRPDQPYSAMTRQYAERELAEFRDVLTPGTADEVEDS